MEPGGYRELNDNQIEDSFSAEYSIFTDGLVEMLQEFEDIWDGHLGMITISKRGVELYDT